MIPWWQRNTIHGRVEVVLMWVLALLMAGLFVLWATIGWSAERDTTQTDCERKMEAAMRAMEFWTILTFDDVEQVSLKVVKHFPFDNYWARLPEEDPALFTPVGLTHTLNARAGAAIVLWQSAKRECWKQP